MFWAKTGKTINLEQFLDGVHQETDPPHSVDEGIVVKISLPKHQNQQGSDILDIQTNLLLV